MSSVRTLALASGAVCVAVALAAAPVQAGVVVSSSGPSASSYPVGKKIGDNERIVLAAGDSLTVLDAGSTRVLRGAGTYTLGQRTAQERSGTFAVLTRQRSAQRVRTGAIRGDDGGKPVTRPNLWYVDITTPGTHCLAAADNIRLWRPSTDAAASYAVQKPGSGSPVEITFGEGEMLLPWDGDALPVTQHSAFLVSSPEKVEARIAFKLLESVPDDPEGLAETLIANGCMSQLEILSTALMDGGVEEAVPG